MKKRVLVGESYVPLHGVYQRIFRWHWPEAELRMFGEVGPLMKSIQSERPDLFLLDDALAIGRGFDCKCGHASSIQLLRWYRPFKDDSKLVITSTNARRLQRELQENNLLEMCDHILQKPSDFGVLEECISGFMR